MHKTDVVVIGAGPAGMTAAYDLARRGARVTVLEAADAVGGMSRTIRLFDHVVDLGPHRFFSSDARVNRLFLDVLGGDYEMVDRLTRIRYRDRFFDYPLRATDAFLKLGVAETTRCVASYAAAQLRGAPRTDDASFEDWVVARFGRRLFEIFFEGYSEKLWGISCTELDADFAAQRIKKFSLGEAIKGALGAKGKHKTLVDRFAYPLGGTGALYERMADRLRDLGGTLRFGARVRGLVGTAERIGGVRLEGGEVLRADHVISTMPLTLMVRGLPGVPQAVHDACGALTFRNTTLVYLHLDGEGHFPDQWVYVNDPEVRTGRITNFRNWGKHLNAGADGTVLALEYWSQDDDALWRADEGELVALATRELASIGLAPGATVRGGRVVRVPRCYPLYRRGYRDHLQVVTEHLRTVEGLTAIGRYGAFKYNNQDHSILMGLLAAERIAGDGRADLWAVNTDYETYQESAVIDETGLVAAR